jgi:hypothetical protein
MADRLTANSVYEILETGQSESVELIMPDCRKLNIVGNCLRVIINAPCSYYRTSRYFVSLAEKSALVHIPVNCFVLLPEIYGMPQEQETYSANTKSTYCWEKVVLLEREWHQKKYVTCERDTCWKRYIRNIFLLKYVTLINRTLRMSIKGAAIPYCSGYCNRKWILSAFRMNSGQLIDCMFTVHFLFLKEGIHSRWYFTSSSVITINYLQNEKVDGSVTSLQKMLRFIASALRNEREGIAWYCGKQRQYFHDILRLVTPRIPIFPPTPSLHTKTSISHLPPQLTARVRQLLPEIHFISRVQWFICYNKLYVFISYVILKCWYAQYRVNSC